MPEDCHGAMLYQIDYGVNPDVCNRAPVMPDNSWLRTMLDDIICSKCLSIDRSQYPRPFNVVLTEMPSRRTCDVIAGTSITLFHKQFVSLFSSDMQEYVFGCCFSSDGSLLNDYVTCYSKHYIMLRGNQHAYYWKCGCCGKIHSEPKNGPRYVLRHDLSNSMLYQDARCCIYLTESLAMNLYLEQWDDIKLIGVPIRE